MFDKSKIGSKMSLRSPSPQPAKLHLLDGEFFTKLGVIFVVLNNGLINKVFQKKGVGLLLYPCIEISNKGPTLEILQPNCVN